MMKREWLQAVHENVEFCYCIVTGLKHVIKIQEEDHAEANGGVCSGRADMAMRPK